VLRENRRLPRSERLEHLLQVSLRSVAVRARPVLASADIKPIKQKALAQANQAVADYDNDAINKGFAEVHRAQI